MILPFYTFIFVYLIVRCFSFNSYRIQSKRYLINKSLHMKRQQQSVPWPIKNVPKTSKGKPEFKHQVPFSEEMYETIKKTIEMLSEQSKEPRPLTVDEAAWFRNAIDIIIEDAYKFSPPPRPIKSNDVNSEK